MSTLTYVYSDSTAVVGPLSVHNEPHAYDLCAAHAQRLTAPRGWEILRVAQPQEDSTEAPAAAHARVTPLAASRVNSEEDTHWGDANSDAASVATVHRFEPPTTGSGTSGGMHAMSAGEASAVQSEADTVRTDEAVVDAVTAKDVENSLSEEIFGQGIFGEENTGPGAEPTRSNVEDQPKAMRIPHLRRPGRRRH